MKFIFEHLKYKHDLLKFQILNALVATSSGTLQLGYGRMNAKKAAGLSSYIIPAVKSQTSLPENTIGKKALKSKNALWQNTNPSDREKSNKKS